MAAVLDSEPATSPADGSPRSGSGVRAVLVWAMVTVQLALIVPLAPVDATESTVSWPRAGEPVASTSLALSPPRPVSFTATLPCAALRAGGDVLRTMPPGAASTSASASASASESAGQDSTAAARPDPTPDRIAAAGLVVSSAPGRADVTLSGERVLSTALPPGNCRLDLTVDAGGLRAALDGAPLALACGTCADVAPPQVSELTTSAQGRPDVGGLGVTLRPDDRYDSSPSLLKTILLIAHLASLTVLFVLLARRYGQAARRWWQGRRHTWTLLRGHLALPDLLVLAVSGAWVVLGPLNFDDSWYPLMARNADAAGYLGNAVYMFNVTENPFVASQYAMQAWGALGGWSLTWMRLLPLLYGLIAWVLLRVYLALALQRARVRRVWVPWSLLVAHLMWWLPFGLTLRPEPLIVLLSVVVLLLVELARLRGAPLLYALAVAAATLAVACSPTGLVAAAPLLVELARWWPRIRASTATERMVAVGILAAAASVAVPVAFADASLGNVLEASAVHAWYYDTVPWYDELVHYQTLLQPGKTPWGQRGPILLTLAVLVLVAAASGRREPTDDSLRRLLLHAAATTAVAFVLVAVSPTKWVLHFPAVAASGTVLLALALLRAPLPRRDRALATTGGVAVLVIAASVSFAGWSLWRPYSDRGQLFGDHADPYPTTLTESLLAPHVGPFFLRNPLMWVAVALLAALWARWALRKPRLRRLPRPEPDRALLWAACLAMVVGMVAVFVLAPLRQYPGWTVALGNVHDITHDGCGLQSTVTALEPTPTPLGAPVTPARVAGDMVDASVFPVSRPVPGMGRTWHDDTPDSSGRGGLETGWYPIPPGTGATDVVVPVLLQNSPDERVRVEFGQGPATAPRIVSQKVIEPMPNADARTWQERPVSLVDLPVQPDVVRVVVEGTGVRGQDRLAVSEPRLVAPRPISEVLGGQPVLVDQSSSTLWPCVDQVAVAGGIAPSPAFRIKADEDLTGAPIEAQDWVQRGGVWRFDDLSVTYVSLSTAVGAGGPRTKPWGRIDMVVRDRPPGLVGVASTTRSEPGWERGPTIATEDYVDVEYQGAVG